MRVVDLNGLYALSSNISGSTSGYNFLGNISDTSQLPTQNRKIGDQYTVEDKHYVWNGTSWDLFSDFNMGDYVTAEEFKLSFTFDPNTETISIG